MEQTHRICVQFLLTDISAALTFLDVAKTTQSPATRQRNRDHALTAYETVMRLLPRVSPSQDELSALQQRLQILKNRLLALGCLRNDESDNAPESENGI